MNDFGHVLLLAAIPAVGNFVGGIAAELVRPSPRRLNYALHAAAGVLIGAVALELLPAVIDRLAGWVFAAAFMLGTLAYLGVDALVDRLAAGKAGSDASGVWMIYAAVCLDLLTDGIAVGSSSTIASRLAIVLAAAQTLADLPEGFAALAKFKASGTPRARRILLSLSFVVPALVGAVIAYSLLRGRASWLQLSALAFCAGLLIVAATEEMIEEAHEGSEDTRTSVLMFAGGFAVFALTRSYF